MLPDFGRDDLQPQAAFLIFAQEAHESRSERYVYIPTIDVLNGLRHEGFEPFMVSSWSAKLAYAIRKKASIPST